MKTLLIPILVALLMGACGGGGDVITTAQAETPKPLIVVIGDSITAGYMTGAGARIQLAQRDAYTAELAPLGRVVTAAVGGSTVAAARTNQLYWLAPLSPRVVVVLLGVNDAGQRADRAAALADMDAIVLAWPTARYVLVSPPKWDASTDAWLTAWAADLQRLAVRRGAEFVDVHTASAAENWRCSDDFHPCEQGHRRMGAMVSDAVRHALTKS